MMDLGLYGLAGAMMLALAYTLVSITVRKGIEHAILAASILVDFFTLVLMVLGIDRPLFLFCTKFGCATVSATMLFLVFKLPATVYLAAKVLKR